jgi:D-psicose/D-tagatose/L-ribulose 3-epimerase
MRYPLAVKTLVLAWLASASCLALGVPPAAPPVGVCVEASRLAEAKAAGFDYVEIGASRVAGLSDEEFEQLVRQVEQLRLPVPAANLFIPGTIKLVGTAIDKQKQEAYVTGCLVRLKRLGVKVVVLGSGGARRVPDGFSRDEALAQLVDFCRRIAPLARQNGITIAVEPLRRAETNIVNSAREGLALVKAVDRAEIRLLVDFYHLAEESESPDVVLEAGALLVHVHVANPKGRAFPSAPDEAAYGPFFANLCKIGYAGRVSIEGSTADFAAQAPKSIAMLRAALACAHP